MGLAVEWLIQLLLVNFGEGGLRLYVSWHLSKEFIFQPTTPQSMLELYPLPCAMLQQCSVFHKVEYCRQAGWSPTGAKGNTGHMNTP